jgi:3-deoxy-manno-octulosonate cytidylyltransferase (CMP-KDO synthetase)
MSRAVAIIPARMASTRLPGKVLLSLAGVPMLQRVYERVVSCRRLADVLVATEDDEIVGFCRARGIPVQLTARHPSGTDRVGEISQRMDSDLFVNVQGDQPLFDLAQMDDLLDVFERRPDAQVGTLVAALPALSVASPHVVKVAVAGDGRALYFSRAAIPHGADAQRWQHIGLYAYTRAALATFRRHGPSPLERLEGLEQLRFLEAGVPIHVGTTAVATPSVDTVDDVAVVERLLARAGDAGAPHPRGPA